MGKEKIDQQFLEQTFRQLRALLRVVRRRTERPCIIAFAGLLGSGNSTIAKALAKPVGATILRSDAIRARFLKPYNKEYHIYTVPLLQRAIEIIFEKGGNVILDRDDAEGKTGELFRDQVKKYHARVLHIRVVADRDVMMRRLIGAKYDAKKNIIRDPVVALREMWRRTPLHYEWQKNPMPTWVLKKQLPLRPIAVIDTSDGVAWKKQLRSVVRVVKKK